MIVVMESVVCHLFKNFDVTLLALVSILPHVWVKVGANFEQWHKTVPKFWDHFAVKRESLYVWRSFIYMVDSCFASFKHMAL